MKGMFWLLVLANVGFAGYMQLNSDQPSKDSKLLQQQLHAEKIVLLDPITFSKQVAVDEKPAPARCLEWGSFSGDELSRAETALTELQLGDRLSQIESAEPVGYWVYIPPFASRAEADIKAGQLNRLRITEHFIIQESSDWRNAISLGVFKTDDAAKNYLAIIKSKGVRSGVIGLYKGQVKHIVFVIKEPNEATIRRVTEIKQTFPDSNLSAAQCAAS